MQGKRLLERFADLEAGRSRTSPDILGDLTASVGAHLARLLNTRQGSVPQAPDYGAPDMGDLAQIFGGKALQEIEDVLSLVVARYEPRLTNVRVVYVQDKTQPLRATFSLSASLRAGDDLVPVVYETLIAPDGHIEIQGYA